MPSSTDSGPRIPSFVKALCTGELLQEVLFPFPRLEGEEAETLAMAIDAIDALLEGHAEDFGRWAGLRERSAG